MMRFVFLLFFIWIGLIAACTGSKKLPDQQERKTIDAAQFKQPKSMYGVSCFWWWLNGHVTKASITRDLEAMHAKGFYGALIFDAGGQNQQGNGDVPEGPMFGSDEWNALFEHAVKEAHRLGLKLGLSIQSGWNLGGPDVSPQESAKLLTWSDTTMKGGRRLQSHLPLPPHRENFYRDIAVLAIPFHPGDTAIKPVADLNVKISAREAAFSAADMRHVFLDDEATADQHAHAQKNEVIDLSTYVDSTGMLTWQAPQGDWTIMRFGYTNNGAHVSTASGKWQGLVLDYLSKEHFLRYWNTHVRPLLESIDTLAGSTLNYLHTDSWELGGSNWTETFREEFEKRRHYDLLAYLPVIAGKIIDSRAESNRFLFDFRKTIGDCIADNHYATFAEQAHQFGIGIHPESGGPHLGPFDGLKNYGRSDLVMSEFWSPSPHRPTPDRRFFVKQAASAAHIYNKRIVGAEAFTTIGHHWDDVIWRDMKSSFDHEVCAGLNRTYIHTFTNSPKEMGLPGQEYFAGTHFNPNITWWKLAKPFFDYIARVQYMAQNGTFQADVLYYYGDQVPNIATRKASDPARALPDYDYDVINEECLLQLDVQDHRITLPYGNKYQILVLPDDVVMSVTALKKITSLVKAGATVIGPKILGTMSLEKYPAAIKTITQESATLWGDVTTPKGKRAVGKGQVAWGYTAKEWLHENDVLADCAFVGVEDSSHFDYIHYTQGEQMDYYFLSNQQPEAVNVDVRFRVTGKLPEFWNPETGEIVTAKAFTQKDGITTIPVSFRPYGSWIVVFKQNIPKEQQGEQHKNFANYRVIDTLAEGWDVTFENNFGQPNKIRFPELMSWTMHPDSTIRYYSGAAMYSQTFTAPMDVQDACFLDLGAVEDVGIARVTLDGKNLGVLWSPPYRVKLGKLQRGSVHTLQVEVINSWRNRLVGDRNLPIDQRYTQTNITIRKDWKLLDAGLIGPVTLQIANDPTE